MHVYKIYFKNESYSLESSCHLVIQLYISAGRQSTTITITIDSYKTITIVNTIAIFTQVLHLKLIVIIIKKRISCIDVANCSDDKVKRLIDFLTE